MTKGSAPFPALSCIGFVASAPADAAAAVAAARAPAVQDRVDERENVADEKGLTGVRRDVAAAGAVSGGGAASGDRRRAVLGMFCDFRVAGAVAGDRMRRC